MNRWVGTLASFRSVALDRETHHTQQSAQAAYVRDLCGVIEREKAEIGVLISMEPPTKPMLKEADEAGLYQPPGLADKYPRIQILSIADLLLGKKIEYPRLLDVTYKKAPKARKAAEQQMPLTGADPEDEGPF